MKIFVTSMTTAGFTLFIAFWISALVFANASFHSDQREASWGAMGAASGLELLWVIGGTLLAITRWRATTVTFRVIFVLNIIVVCLIAKFL